MIVTGIDIGLHHMGLMKGEIDDKNYNKFSLDKFDLIDLSKYGEKEIYLMLDHMFKEYADYFDVDKLIIERQPPGGLLSIQEVIAFKYKDIVNLVSPRSVHCFIGSNYYTYDRRKLISIDYTIKYLIRHMDTDIKKQFFALPRKHDIADAFCMIAYFGNKVLYTKRRIPPIKENVQYGVNLDEYFEQFKLKN